MPKKYFSVQNKTETSVDMLIYGIIGDSWYEESITARQFVAELNSLQKDYKRINVRLNSPGGSVFDGLPIFNAIRNCTAEIHTYNDGLCASMAGVLLMAAPSGNVHSADNALLMLHSPYSGCYGNKNDMKQCLDLLEKVEQSLITCIESRGHSTAEEIKSKYFDGNDHWISVDDAKTEGLIDTIEKGNKKISDKITQMPLDKVIDEFDTLVKGRGILDKFFSQIHDFFSTNNIETDMDIKALRKACGLPDDATEQDVLDWIREHEHAEADDQADDDAGDDTDEASDDEEDADDSETPDPKDREIAILKAQVEALKKAPGAKDKKVAKQTDSKSGNGLKNSFEVYTSAKAIFDQVSSLVD